MQVAARAVEERFNADSSDCLGPVAPCRCGELARYAGRRPKTFESVLGPLTLERAYYHCQTCGAGFCPRDRSLGLEGETLTPGVLRMVGLVGAMGSFEEGQQLLSELAGVEVSSKQVERDSEALGREVAQDERRVVAPAPSPAEVAPTLYLGIDGTGVPMRAHAGLRIGRSVGQAARWLIQDAGGQAGHGLERPRGATRKVRRCATKDR